MLSKSKVLILVVLVGLVASQDGYGGGDDDFSSNAGPYHGDGERSATEHDDGPNNYDEGSHASPSNYDDSSESGSENSPSASSSEDDQDGAYSTLEGEIASPSQIVLSTIAQKRSRRSIEGQETRAARVRRGGYGYVGPVYTYVKTDHDGNFKWGARHLVGKQYGGHHGGGYH